MHSPFMIEKPVIFAKPMAKAPPASSDFPMWLKKSMEITDFENTRKVVVATGHADVPSNISSSTTYNTNKFKIYQFFSITK